MLPTVIRPREGSGEAPAAVTCFEHENDFLIFALGNDRRYVLTMLNEVFIIVSLLKNNAVKWFFLFESHVKIEFLFDSFGS